MSKVHITFWEFLWKNLSIIKTCGLILVLFYTIWCLYFIWNNISRFISSEYVVWEVQENTTHSEICYRNGREYTCTKHNSIISYFDARGNNKVFESELVENQRVGEEFVVIYGSDYQNTLVDSLLILWFQVFVLLNIMPVYLMIFEAYNKENTTFVKWKPPYYKKVYRFWMLFWFLNVGFSIFIWGSVWFYFSGSPIMSISMLLLWVYVLYQMFQSFKEV
jgi:hypothetical protein